MTGNTIDMMDRACEDARRTERESLRALLERCEALVSAQLHLHQRLSRQDAKGVALLENLLTEIRHALGKD